MQCLKCGRETTGKEVFCPDCLALMAASPIKPDTPVPQFRRDTAAKKSPARKTYKQEDQIVHLQRTVRRLQTTVAVLALLFVLSAGTALFLLYRSYAGPSIGSNYSTIATESTDG